MASCFGIATTTLAGQAQAQNPSDLARRFEYNRSQPFDLRDSVLTEDEGAVVETLSFASGTGRVTAYLVRPTTSGTRRPAILFGHWGLGNKTEFLSEAKIYARLGAVSLLIDNPWVRPAPWRRDEGPLDRPEVDRDVHLQAVVDLRRGLDLLEARADVDTARIAYVGHSYGAQWGAILSAIERRLKGVVLMAGVPDDRAILMESDDPGPAAYRSRWTAAQLERYLEVNGVLDAVRYVGHAGPTPKLMQFARLEPVIPMAATERYIAAAKDPKTVSWYDTGHELNDLGAFFERATWLSARLGLGPLEPEILRLLRRGAQVR